MPSAPLRLSLDRDSLGADRSDVRVRAPPTSVATICSNHPEPCRSLAVGACDESHVRHRAGHIGRVLQAGVQVPLAPPGKTLGRRSLTRGGVPATCPLGRSVRFAGHVRRALVTGRARSDDVFPELQLQRGLLEHPCKLHLEVAHVVAQLHDRDHLLNLVVDALTT